MMLRAHHRMARQSPAEAAERMRGFRVAWLLASLERTNAIILDSIPPLDRGAMVALMREAGMVDAGRAWVVGVGTYDWIVAQRWPSLSGQNRLRSVDQL